MCIGEVLDTIDAGETEHLRAAAREDFPEYRFGIHANSEGLTWVVLDPPARQAHLLRFTICRISPCVMVMVEDAQGRRRFGSADGVADAMVFARHASDQAILVASNAHAAHRVLQ